MIFVIVLLTLALIVDCALLIFLVLIQLPKKEAGAGLAFGASATDALFGAGSGTVLTKITKYAATGFFLLAVILSILQSNYHRRTSSAFTRKISGSGPNVPAAAPAAIPQPGSSTNPAVAQPSTNPLKINIPPQAEQPIAPATTNPPTTAPPTNPPAPQ